MENSYDFNGPKIDLPNATVVLVLGIVSIVTCWCYGIIGIVCAIIALVLAKSAASLYVSSPEKYTEGSFKNMNAGKVCAWIGLSLSILYLIFVIVIFLTVGFGALSDPNTIFGKFGG